jgi:hypothetical protein
MPPSASSSSERVYASANVSAGGGIINQQAGQVQNRPTSAARTVRKCRDPAADIAKVQMTMLSAAPPGTPKGIMINRMSVILSRKCVRSFGGLYHTISCNHLVNGYRTFVEPSGRTLERTTQNSVGYAMGSILLGFG